MEMWLLCRGMMCCLKLELGGCNNDEGGLP